MYDLLCKLGIHIKYAYATEEGTDEHVGEFRECKKCDCGTKKEYLYDGMWVTDNDLLGYGRNNN